jgi:DNA-directed RNA polymerase subunit RPC12/RpoP
MTDLPAAAAAHTYPCGGCGARVQFAPGTNVLRCPYCGYQQEITSGDRQVREIAFAELGALPRKPVGSIGAYVLVCQQCAAKTETNEVAGLCQFCGSPLVVDATATGQIVPEAVLPFHLDRGGMRDSLGKWTSSRWFAPSALKKVREAESTKGTYVPHWTFDSATLSRYSGQRGEHYYETEYYTDSNGNRQSRQVQRTRWYPARGTVDRFFDDVLIPASVVLPQKKLGDLAPWPLTEAAPYQPQYLAGHFALRYDVEPEPAFDTAKVQMSEVIREDCRRDIGGDEQRVNEVSTQHDNVTFKLMLLPVWIATYLYAGKTWQILINGCTGEVHGERPYSRLKIALAILLALAVIAAIVIWIVASKHR